MNLQRKFNKLFASAGGQIGQFGSAQDSLPVISTDLDTIQNLPAYEVGWSDAVLSGDKRPPLEEMNAINYVNSYQNTYLLQKGIPEWNLQTAYYVGDISRPVAGTKLYKSIDNNNIGNPLTDIANWQLLGDLADLSTVLTLGTAAFEDIGTANGTIPVIGAGDKLDSSLIDDAGIDHTLIANVGSNSHAQIDLHISDIANPHSVTASQVGNAVAQWNANQLQGKDISVAAPTEGQMLVYRSSSSSWEVETTSLGFIGFVDNVVATPIATINTPVLVDQPTYSSFELIGFDQPTNSRLRYIGTEPRKFKISVNVCLFAASNDRLMTIYIGLNGSVINNSKSSNITKAGECSETSIDFIQTLSNNEYLEIFVENNDNTDDITCAQIRIIANEIK